MAKYTQQDVQNATSDIQNGMALTTAAKIWSVPRSTLQDRVCGTKSHQTAETRFQRLSPIQEHLLVEWIRTQGALGLPPTHNAIRYFVTRILVEEGDVRPLGKHWMEGFFKRNPSVRTLPGKNIDSKIYKGFN